MTCVACLSRFRVIQDQLSLPLLALPLTQNREAWTHRKLEIERKTGTGKLLKHIPEVLHYTEAALHVLFAIHHNILITLLYSS